MSDARNPFAAMAALQRRSIEQSRQAFHWGADIGKQTNRMALDGVESSESVQRQGTEMAHTAVTAYLDALAAVTPGDDATVENLQTAIDDQFDAADTVNEQLWNALHDVLEENARSYEEFADQSLELVDIAHEEALDSLARFEETTTETASTE